VPYPLSLFKNDSGSLVEKIVSEELEETFYRKAGYCAAGEGFLKDPATLLNNEGKEVR
jgi:hypothetical protein